MAIHEGDGGRCADSPRQCTRKDSSADTPHPHIVRYPADDPNERQWTSVDLRLLESIVDRALLLNNLQSGHVPVKALQSKQPLQLSTNQPDYLSGPSPRKDAIEPNPSTTSLGREISNVVAQRIAKNLRDFLVGPGRETAPNETAIFLPPLFHADPYGGTVIPCSATGHGSLLQVPSAYTGGYLPTTPPGYVLLPTSPIATTNPKRTEGLAVACAAAGAYMFVASWLSIVSLRHSLEPLTVMVEIYLGVFGLVITWLEGGSWMPGCTVFAEFVDKWCRLLSTTSGKGSFYLFCASLALSFWKRSLWNIVAGTCLGFVGLIRLHSPTRPVVD